MSDFLKMSDDLLKIIRHGLMIKKKNLFVNIGSIMVQHDCRACICGVGVGWGPPSTLWVGLLIY